MRKDDEEDTASGGSPQEPDVSDPQEVDPKTGTEDDKPIDNPSGG